MLLFGGIGRKLKLWKFRVWKSKKYEKGFKSSQLTVRLPLAISEKEVLKNKELMCLESGKFTGALTKSRKSF